MNKKDLNKIISRVLDKNNPKVEIKLPSPMRPGLYNKIVKFDTDLDEVGINALKQIVSNWKKEDRIKMCNTYSLSHIRSLADPLWQFYFTKALVCFFIINKLEPSPVWETIIKNPQRWLDPLFYVPILDRLSENDDF